jgi:hypothetical protein
MVTSQVVLSYVVRVGPTASLHAVEKRKFFPLSGMKSSIYLNASLTVLNLSQNFAEFLAFTHGT